MSTPKDNESNTTTPKPLTPPDGESDLPQQGIPDYPVPTDPGVDGKGSSNT